MEQFRLEVGGFGIDTIEPTLLQDLQNLRCMLVNVVPSFGVTNMLDWLQDIQEGYTNRSVYSLFFALRNVSTVLDQIKNILVTCWQSKVPFRTKAFG